MMDIVAISVVSVVAFIFSLSLKKYHPSISLIIVLFTYVMILLYLLDYFGEVTSYIKELFNSVNIKSEYITLLLKCTGICFITEFTCDMCKESGYTSLSSQISLAGKVITLIMALPLFREVLSISLSLAGAQ